MSTATAPAVEVADLKHKLDLADENITFIYRRLDEAPGVSWDSQLMHV